MNFDIHESPVRRLAKWVQEIVIQTNFRSWNPNIPLLTTRFSSVCWLVGASSIILTPAQLLGGILPTKVFFFLRPRRALPLILSASLERHTIQIYRTAAKNTSRA